MRHLSICCTCLAAAALTACAGNPTAPGVEVEVEDVSDRAPIERTPETPSTPAPESSTRAATTALLASAQSALDARDHSTAIAFLERAVRLSPRDPMLWVKLSDTHLGSGNLAAAQQHARKAIALAADDPVLARAAWLQLADVLQAQGETDEARSIRRRYRSVPG